MGDLRFAGNNTSIRFKKSFLVL